MAGGIAASIVAFSVGAVLDFAVTVGPDQHGFNIHNVGVILMIVGAVGVVLSSCSVRRKRASSASYECR